MMKERTTMRDPTREHPSLDPEETTAL